MVAIISIIKRISSLCLSVNEIYLFYCSHSEASAMLGNPPAVYWIPGVVDHYRTADSSDLNLRKCLQENIDQDQEQAKSHTEITPHIPANLDILLDGYIQRIHLLW